MSVSLWIDFTGGTDGEGKALAWLRDKAAVISCEGVEEFPDEIYPGVSGGYLRVEPIPIGEAPDWPVHASVASGPWHDTLTFFRLGADLPVNDSIQVGRKKQMCLLQVRVFDFRFN